MYGGSTGTDVLTVDDSGTREDVAYTIYSNLLMDNYGNEVNYFGCEEIALYASGGDDTINIESTVNSRMATIFCGGGDDTVNVAPTTWMLSQVPGLTLYGGGGSPTGTLDLARGGAIVNYPVRAGSPLSALRAQMLYARSAGWAGTGITSSLARSQPGTYGIAMAEATSLLGPEGGTFMGVTLAPGDRAVLMRTTILGDANMDGMVDVADYQVWFNNYGQGTTWVQGNFKVAGVTDVADYQNWFNHYGMNMIGGGSGAGGAGGAALPGAVCSGPVRAFPVRSGPVRASVAASEDLVTAIRGAVANTVSPASALDAIRAVGLVGLRPTTLARESTAIHPELAPTASARPPHWHRPAGGQELSESSDGILDCLAAAGGRLAAPIS